MRLRASCTMRPLPPQSRTCRQSRPQRRPGIGQGPLQELLVVLPPDLEDDLLVGLGCTEDEVDVGVDQAGQDGAAGKVVPFAGGQKSAIDRDDSAAVEPQQRANDSRRARTVKETIGGDDAGAEHGGASRGGRALACYHIARCEQRTPWSHITADEVRFANPVVAGDANEVASPARRRDTAAPGAHNRLRLVSRAALRLIRAGGTGLLLSAAGGRLGAGRLGAGRAGPAPARPLADALCPTAPRAPVQPDTGTAART